MGDKPATSMHFGGPLGLAGLALLAGTTGAVIVSERSGGDDVKSTSQVAVSDVVLPAEQAEGDDEDRFVPAAQSTIPVSANEAPKTGGAELIYVVRFKDVYEIDAAARLYRKDPDAAQAAYRAYQEKVPELADFRLVGASFSGELKLSYPLEPGVEASRSVVRQMQEKLTGLESVAYADPDYVAHPGKGN